MFKDFLFWLMKYNFLLRNNRKSSSTELKMLKQAHGMPTPSLTVPRAPEARSKPSRLSSCVSKPFQFHEPASTVGMAKLKKRTSVPTPGQPQSRTVPDQTPTCSQISQTQNPAPVTRTILPKGVPIVIMPAVSHTSHSAVQPEKRSLAQDPTVPKRKYVRTATTVTCGKCGENRLPPAHQQYMGYRYCQLKDGVPFAEWRENLKQQGVARKKNKDFGIWIIFSLYLQCAYR